MPQKPLSLTAENHQRLLKAWKDAGYVSIATAEKLKVGEATFRRHMRLARQWAATPAGNEWCQVHDVDMSQPRKGAVSAPEVQVSELRHQLSRLERAYHEQERHNITVRGIRQHIFGLAEHKPFVPDWVNDRATGSYHHGVPTLMLSDLHFGEVVKPEQVFGINEYNMEIAERRIRHTVDTACYLLQDDVLRDPDFPGIVLVLGGDMVSGIIHDELNATNQSQIMSQAMECADIIHAVILKLIRQFGKVFVVGVPGNHGRLTRKPYAKDYAELSFDWLIYQMLERFLMSHTAKGEVTFNCPPARDVTFKIAGRPFRLTHGDQFRGGDGIIGPLGPITRGDKKKRAMAMTLPDSNQWYETLLLGHFHTLHQDARRIINGSTKGYDEYALSQNFEFEPPQQALFLTHARYGINHAMPVLCEEPPKAKVKPAAWVQFEQNHKLTAPIRRYLDGLDWVHSSTE